MKKKFRWDLVWLAFFTACFTSFAVSFTLQATREISIPWGWVFFPAIVMVVVPLLVVLIATIITLMKGDEDD